VRDQDEVEIAQRAAPTVRDQDAIKIARRAAPKVRDRRWNCHRGIDERRSVLCQPVQSRAGKRQRHEHQPEDVGRRTLGGRLLSKTGRNTSARSPSAGKHQRWDSARARFVGPEGRRVAHHRSPGRRQGRATLRSWSGFARSTSSISCAGKRQQHDHPTGRHRLGDE